MNAWGLFCLFMGGLMCGVGLGILFCEWLDKCAAANRSMKNTLLPALSKEECPGCHREIWVMYSRVDPKVWTAEGFKRDWDVNEKTKEVTPKRGLSSVYG